MGADVVIFSYELLCITFGFIAYCYSKSLKHIMASRCTSIRFGCISCDRQPLGDEVAREIVESPDVLLGIGSPTINLRSITI